MKRPLALKLMIALAATLAAGAAWPQQPFDLDPTFRTEINAINVNDVLPLPGGDIMISGQIRFPGEMYAKGYARLSPTGERVLPFPDFTPGGGWMIPWGVEQFYVQNGIGMRLINFDGSIDTAFSMITRPYYHNLLCADAHIYPDGSMLVGGWQLLTDTARGFVGEYGFVWFSNQGYLDTTRTHRRTGEAVQTMKLVQDGKFLCSGGGGMVEGMPCSTIFRVDADAVLDTTFNAPYLQFGVGYDYKPLAEGKILAGGYFRFLGSTDTLSLVRFLSDGQVDPTFHTPYCEVNYNSSSFPIVSQITPLGSDRYIITGNFNRVDGQVRGGIALLDTAGNLLDDFFTGSGCDGFLWPLWPPGLEIYHRSILGIHPLPDGSYYLYGAYHGYDDGTTNDTLQRMVSRLYGLDVGIHEPAAGGLHPLVIAPNPSAGSTVLSVEKPLGQGVLTVHDASGRVVLQEPWPVGTITHTLRAGLLAPGTYLLRVQEEQGTLHTGKLIILP